MGFLGGLGMTLVNHNTLGIVFMTINPFMAFMIIKFGILNDD